jgi:hypothetical protein
MTTDRTGAAVPRSTRHGERCDESALNGALLIGTVDLLP